MCINQEKKNAINATDYECLLLHYWKLLEPFHCESLTGWHTLLFMPCGVWNMIVTSHW